MFTYLHPYAFVFIHKAQLLESFPHIKGSLPMVDLYTVHVRVISDLPPCSLVTLHVLVQGLSVSVVLNLCLIPLMWQTLCMPPKVKALSCQTCSPVSHQTLTVICIITQPVMQRWKERRFNPSHTCSSSKRAGGVWSVEAFNLLIACVSI